MDTAVPSRELLRELAALQGAEATDADVEAVLGFSVLGFLQVLGPALAELEALLPQDCDP